VLTAAVGAELAEADDQQEAGGGGAGDEGPLADEADEVGPDGVEDLNEEGDELHGVSFRVVLLGCQ
jgi:hypothetical protein